MEKWDCVFITTTYPKGTKWKLAGAVNAETGELR
jgi:hypothetical protein